MQDEGGCWTEKKDGETRTHACAFVRACRRERRWMKGEREGWMDGENLFRFVETRLSVLIVPLSLSLSFLTRLKRYGIARIGEANSVVLKLVAFEPRFRIGGTLYSMFLNALSKGRIGFFFSEEKETFDV